MPKINVRDRNKNTGRKPNWEYRFETATIAGKRQCVSKSGFRTKKEALEAGAAALADYDGTSEQNKRFKNISFADYLNLWLENNIKPTKKPRTYKKYFHIVQSKIIPKLGAYKVQNLSYRSLQNFLNELCDGTFVAPYYASIRFVLYSALRDAVHPYEIIKKNPAEYIRIPETLPHYQPKEKNVLTPEQFKIILEQHPVGNPFRPCLLLGWYFGLRISECLTVLWEDIDIEKRTLAVRRQMISADESDGNEYLLTCSLPKYNSVRTITFGKNILKELLKIKWYQEDHTCSRDEYVTFFDGHNLKQVQGKNCPKGQELVHPVCLRKNGRMFNEDSVADHYQRVSKNTSIPFTSHTLRHSNATLLYENHVPLKVISARLGHKNIATTFETYTHKTETMDAEALKVLDAIITLE